MQVLLKTPKYHFTRRSQQIERSKTTELFVLWNDLALKPFKTEIAQFLVFNDWKKNLIVQLFQDMWW